MTEEPKSALERFRKTGDPFHSVLVNNRERAEYTMVEFLKGGIREGMMCVTKDWHDGLEKLTDNIAREQLEKMKEIITIAECERVLFGIASEDARLTNLSAG